MNVRMSLVQWVMRIPLVCVFSACSYIFISLAIIYPVVYLELDGDKMFSGVSGFLLTGIVGMTSLFLGYCAATCVVRGFRSLFYSNDTSQIE